MSAFTDLYGDWLAGLFNSANLNKKPLSGMYGNAQSRPCPNSLHLLKRCEKYATSKLLKLTLVSGMKSIQAVQARCETGRHKRMLFSAGHPCAYALPASPGLDQFTHTKTISRYVNIQIALFYQGLGKKLDAAPGDSDMLSSKYLAGFSTHRSIIFCSQKSFSPGRRITYAHLIPIP